MKRSSWHRRAGAVVLAWLAATVLVALVHRQVPAPLWLMVHLLLLGAVTNAILIWSGHFATTLLRLPDTRAKSQQVRLIGLNVAVIAVIAGVLANTLPLVVLGAIGVAIAIAWHVIELFLGMRRALPSRFGLTGRYYIAAGLLLILGIGLAVELTRGGSGAGTSLVLSHATINLFGWVGLSILGTLITLWPTMLHTRVSPDAQQHGRIALVPLVIGTLVAAAGLVLAIRPLAVVGVVGYAIGIVALAGPFVSETRARRPNDFATWSVLAGLAWLVGCVSAYAVILAIPGSWEQTADRAGWLTAAATVGFVAQVLLGSLSYLLPVMVGGGPTVLKWRNSVVNRGAATRVVAANTGLLVCVLPVPSVVRVLASVVVLGALTWALPLLVRVLFTPPTDSAAPATLSASAARTGGTAVAGLAIVLLAISLGAAVDPSALGATSVDAASASGNISATGQTTRVRVTTTGMRFTPETIDVPAGNRLVLDLVNTGDNIHDLTLDTGQSTPQIAPGESAELDVGVVGRNIEGWCSVAGHKQMGMVLHIVAIGGGPAPDTAMNDMASHDMSGMTPGQATDTGEGFVPVNPVLAPAGNARVHRVRLPVIETVQEVAPGVRETRWTYGGRVPGPTLRGRIGDRFVITLVNKGSMGHSIDFHAGALAPDRPMRTIAPGEELTYVFTATRAGIWMYHCSTMPMSMHIANGMFGAVIIDPPLLPKVDREFLLIQSEIYSSSNGFDSELEKIVTDRPDFVVFNGYANQYDKYPLTTRVGKRIRIWVLNVGPDRTSAFHVVGGQFDTVYKEGTYSLRGGGPGGSQVLGLVPAQGGFVELVLPERGNYPFVSHVMVDAERGAHGLLSAR